MLTQDAEHTPAPTENAGAVSRDGLGSDMEGETDKMNIWHTKVDETKFYICNECGALLPDQDDVRQRHFDYHQRQADHIKWVTTEHRRGGL